MIALGLRITVEMFRVMSQDTQTITPKTLIDYFNATELNPFTISQLMDLFEIYGTENI